MDRKKLAIVDKNKNMTIYDLITKEVIIKKYIILRFNFYLYIKFKIKIKVLSTEMQVTSCAFNTLFNETIAYSG